MAKRISGLGRGLDAIFLDNSIEDLNEKSKNGVNMLKLSLIDPKSDQPRKYFDKALLEELANSIKDNGVLQPILVREYGEGRYQIIAGERRFRASKIAELTEIPAIILDSDDRKVAEISLIENIQREDLNPVEEALAYRSLSEEFGLTQEELAAKVGKSRSAVANTVRLLDLPKDVLELVASNELSQGHARTLLGLKDRDNMIILANKTIVEDLSVRALEELVKKVNKPKKAEDDGDIILPVVDYIHELEIKVQNHLGRRVKLENKGKKKFISIYYENNEDLDELLEAVCGKDFMKNI